MIRFSLILALAVVLGGAGIMYVWSTLNLFARGAASPEQAGAAVAVTALVVALVAAVYRFLDRLTSRPTHPEA